MNWLKVVGVGVAVVAAFMVVELILRVLYWGILAAVLVGAVVVALKLRRVFLGAKDHQRELERDHPTVIAAPTTAPDTTEDLRRLKREMGID